MIVEEWVASAEDSWNEDEWIINFVNWTFKIRENWTFSLRKHWTCFLPIITDYGLPPRIRALQNLNLMFFLRNLINHTVGGCGAGRTPPSSMDLLVRFQHFFLFSPFFSSFLFFSSFFIYFLFFSYFFIIFYNF